MILFSPPLPSQTGADAPAFSARTGAVLTICFAAMIVVCLVLPRAMSFLPALIGAGGVAAYYAAWKKFPPFDRGLFALVGGLLALGAFSALWSIDPGYSLGRALKNAEVLLPSLPLIAVACAMPRANALTGKILSVVILCAALAAAGLFFEYHSAFLLSRIALGLQHTDAVDLPGSITNEFLLNRSHLFLILTAMPLTLGLLISDLRRPKKIALAVIFYGCVAASLVATKSQTAQFSAALGVAMALYPSHKIIFRRLVLLGTLAALCASPWIMAPAYKMFFASPESREQAGLIHEASVPHRLEVWKFVSEEILKRPLLGYGVDTTRFLRAGYIMKNMNTNQVMHPHSAILQIWEEFGLVGILLVTALLIYILRKIDRLGSPLLQRYYTALYVVSMSMLMMGYGLWQPWLLGMIIAMPAFSQMLVRLYQPEPRS